MKQVLYKNDIYPYNVRVLLGADEEYIVKTFANLEVEELVIAQVKCLDS